MSSCTVLAVCGLAVEVRLAAGPGVRTVAGGGRSLALAAAIERELAAGVEAIVSFGVAGALLPALHPGALVVASGVVRGIVDDFVDAAENFPVDAEWTRALLRLLPAAIHAPLAGCDTVVADPHGKSRLHTQTGASAVDMESHIAARIAAEHGLPFAALRAIADPLARTLPPAASIAMTVDGRIDMTAVMRSLARTPHQLPQLVRVAFDMQRALSALARGRRLLGNGLGYPNLDELLLHVI